VCNTNKVYGVCLYIINRLNRFIADLVAQLREYDVLRWITTILHIPEVPVSNLGSIIQNPGGFLSKYRNITLSENTITFPHILSNSLSLK
jgi:hypothetical protein